MMAITYRTTDLAQWGAGQGSNLSAAQVDANFWTLYQAIQSVTAQAGVGVASATVSGDQLSFGLTDGTTLGPYTLPTVTLNPRGNWSASTAYAVNDVVSASGNVYLVTFAHTSGATFSAGANDGAGHDYYGLLFNIPGNTLPVGGATGQVLKKNSATNYDTGWTDHTLDNLGDVSVTEGSSIDGQFLKWANGSGAWVAAKPTEIPSASVSASGVLSINRNNGEIVRVSLTGNVTAMTVSNWPASGTFGRIVLEISNTGAYGISGWPTGTIWPGGSAPTITSGSGKKDIIILMTFDGGTTIYGSIAGQDYA